MAEGAGLLNRFTGNRNVGSNPIPSATSSFSRPTIAGPDLDNAALRALADRSMRTAARNFAKPALRPAALLAILAILLRASIPGGFMLSAAKAGGMPDLVICTAQGLMTIAGDHAPGSDDDSGKQQDTSCAFTAVASVTITPTLLSIATPIYAEAVVVQRAIPDQRPGRGLAAPPPPTTGPPSLLA